MEVRDGTLAVVLLATAVVFSIQLQEISGDPVPRCLLSEPPEPGCACYQYWSDGECRNCTECSSSGQLTLSTCTARNDSTCTCGESQFFNATAHRCQNCTVCASFERQTVQCTATRDARCVSKCLPHQFYISEEDRCSFDCKLCRFGCVSTGTARCRCKPSNCYAAFDLLCENNLCSATESTLTEASTGLRHSSSDHFPTWGIGLVSIGVVIGIVVFSSGLMVFSYCTQQSNTAVVDAEKSSIPPTESSNKADLIDTCKYHSSPLHSLQYLKLSEKCSSLRNSSGGQVMFLQNSSQAPHTLQPPNCKTKRAMPI